MIWLCCVEADVEHGPRARRRRRSRAPRRRPRGAGQPAATSSRARAHRGLGRPSPSRGRGSPASTAYAAKREEPREVEVEPVGQDELEADQQRARQRGELERRLPPRAGTATATRAGDEQPLEHLLEPVQVREARAWYWRQSQSENGESRSICGRDRPVPEDARGVERVRLEQQHPERGDRRRVRSRRRRSAPCAGSAGTPGRSPTAARRAAPRTSSTPASAGEEPRAPSARSTSQKPQIRKAGMIASFVFELETYCVNG